MAETALANRPNGAVAPNKAQDGAAVIERVVIEGDLSKLSPAERVAYYRRVCESLGLNPYTKPFDYIVLNGKLTLYARKDATEQLRKLHGVSITIVAREWLQDLGVYAVTARATTPDGRTDEAIGAVHVAGLKGESLANALMKAETKAKRRVTLSICGLGWLDETEVSDIPDARAAMVDHETGEVVQQQTPAPAPAAMDKPLRPAARPAQAAVNGKASAGKSNGTAKEGVTKAQLVRIKELLTALGWSAEDAALHAESRYGVRSARELSREQADDMIRWLEDYLLTAEDVPDDAMGEAEGGGEEA